MTALPKSAQTVYPPFLANHDAAARAYTNALVNDDLSNVRINEQKIRNLTGWRLCGLETKGYVVYLRYEVDLLLSPFKNIPAVLRVPAGQLQWFSPKPRRSNGQVELEPSSVDPYEHIREIDEEQEARANG